MRLIDAHMLLEELQKATALSTRGPEYNRGLLEAQRLTINAPTEEERPRGEWGEWDESNGYPCSVCGKYLPYTEEYDYQTPFCPSCGAEMDGDEE